MNASTMEFGVTETNEVTESDCFLELCEFYLACVGGGMGDITLG